MLVRKKRPLRGRASKGMDVCRALETRQIWMDMKVQRIVETINYSVPEICKTL